MQMDWLVQALRWIARWAGRIVISSLFAAVLLMPVATNCLPFKNIDATQELVQLDALPWIGLLRFAYALVYLFAMILLWILLQFVWQRELDGVGLTALVLSMPLCIVGVVSSDRLFSYLANQEVKSKSVYPSLVLANYTTTKSFKGSHHTDRWVDFIHPLQQGQVLKLTESWIAPELRQPGQVVCLTVLTGVNGQHWLARPQACGVGQPIQPLPRLGVVVVKPELLEFMSAVNKEGIDPFFDKKGRVWALHTSGVQPVLAPATYSEAEGRASECRLLGVPRASSDRRSFVSIQSYGYDDAYEAPKLPAWMPRSSQVLVTILGSDDPCATPLTLTHVDHVLDADFDDARQQLALITLPRIPESGGEQHKKKDRIPRVMVYQFDGSGRSRLVHEHVLSLGPQWGPAPKNAQLRWQSGGLVLQHRNPYLPSHKLLSSLAPTDKTGPQGNESPPPPVIGQLDPFGWRMADSAQDGSVGLYLNDNFEGALLFHHKRGVWYYIPPISLTSVAKASRPEHVEQEDLDFFHFRGVRAKLSPDGHRLLTCGPKYVFSQDRCVLLGLP